MFINGSTTACCLSSLFHNRLWRRGFSALKTRIITPVFKEFREGEYKFITFNAKRARGLMTRFIIDHKLSDPEQIKLFNYEGYGFMEQPSKKDQWVFVR